jgi:hypothetical protein
LDWVIVGRALASPGGTVGGPAALSGLAAPAALFNRLDQLALAHPPDADDAHRLGHPLEFWQEFR